MSWCVVAARPAPAPLSGAVPATATEVMLPLLGGRDGLGGELGLDRVSPHEGGDGGMVAQPIGRRDGAPGLWRQRQRESERANEVVVGIGGEFQGRGGLWGAWDRILKHLDYDALMISSKGAMFLDRNGTLIVDRGYTHRIDDFQWVTGAVLASKRLDRVGVPVFIVTNQRGISVTVTRRGVSRIKPAGRQVRARPCAVRAVANRLVNI